MNIFLQVISNQPRYIWHFNATKNIIVQSGRYMTGPDHMIWIIWLPKRNFKTMIYRVASLPKICFDCTVLYIVFTVNLFSPNALDYLGHVRKNEETLMHVIQDRLPEVLEDSCKSWMKHEREVKHKRKSWQKDRNNNRRGTVDTELLFTWNVGKMCEMDGVWPQMFPIDVHGFSFSFHINRPVVSSAEQ